MANKERNKRSARKARAQERTERDVVSQPTASTDKDKGIVAKVTKSAETPKAAPAKASKESAKPKRFAGIRNYFSQVRTEMRRVVWPSREELKNYSVAVIVMLVIFGVAVWVVDTGVAAALVGFAGLRG